MILPGSTAVTEPSLKTPTDTEIELEQMLQEVTQAQAEYDEDREEEDDEDYGNDGGAYPDEDSMFKDATFAAQNKPLIQE